MKKIKIKLLGISCNHRKPRNTAWLTLYALKAAEKFGRKISDVADIEIEFIELSDNQKKILNAAVCKLSDGQYELSTGDYVTAELLPKMAAADGFIFGSPVFTGAYTSKFITLFEHLRVAVADGCLTNKPAGCVSVATMPTGGQDRCLESMDMSIRALGMIPVHALFGCAGISGVPYGPLPGDDDGKVIGVKTDRFAQWTAILVGRRVAEVAVIQKLAKRSLGKLYETDFIQRYRLPFGGESWAWTELDQTEQDFMAHLDAASIKEWDEKVLSREQDVSKEQVKLKILGLGCDDYQGVNTNWLVINALKAIEKFGRKLGAVANIETEFIDLCGKKINPCMNCDHYHDMPNGGRRWRGEAYPPPDSHGCIVKNDYFAKEIFPRYAEADGVIFGSSVCTLNPSITFRLVSQRLVNGIWFGVNNLKPTANIAVGYDQEGGQESCLNVMNSCNRWTECIPVSWPHGVPASGGSAPGAANAVVRDDPMACALSVVNARRVAEFALMNKLALRELGDVYQREFYYVIHPPHGDANWEWSRLDKEDDDYMLSLTPAEMAALGK